MNEFPYVGGPDDTIVVNAGWRRDCRCRMDPCNVPWHYARTDAHRWMPGDPYIEPPRTVK